MSVIDKLVCSLGRRDEVPNQELAHQLADANDLTGIREIAENLWNKDPAIQADCIKVLYEIGYLKPELVAPYAEAFLRLLKNRNNRLVWGGMIALSTVGAAASDKLFPHWGEISKAMDGGSVITRDAGVLTLACIASPNADRRAAIFPFLLDHLRTCRPKDVPQHCEKTLLAVDSSNMHGFIAILQKRMEDLQGRQVERVQKVIKLARQK